MTCQGCGEVTNNVALDNDNILKIFHEGKYKFICDIGFEI